MPFVFSVLLKFDCWKITMQRTGEVESIRLPFGSNSQQFSGIDGHPGELGLSGRAGSGTNTDPIEASKSKSEDSASFHDGDSYPLSGSQVRLFTRFINDNENSLNRT